MKASIFTKITTPFKHEFKGDLDYIEIPTISGVIGIYPNHMPLISAISEGTLKIHSSEGDTLEFQVKGGFIKLHKNNCVITIKSIKKLQKTA